jgi:single-stranded DNA-binding protein
MTNPQYTYTINTPATNVTLLLKAITDAELRYTPNGKPVLSVVAVAEQAYLAADGSWARNSSMYKVSLWGDAGIRMHEAGREPKKFSVLLVEASSAKLVGDSYTNKDGEVKHNINVNASSLKVIARPVTPGSENSVSVNEPIAVADVDMESIPF